MASLANVKSKKAKANDSYGYVFLCHSDVTKIACDAWLAAMHGVLDCYNRRIYSFGPLRQNAARVRYKDSWIYYMTTWPSYQQKAKMDLPRPYFINIHKPVSLNSYKSADFKYNEAVDKMVEQVGIWIDFAVEDLKGSKPLYGRDKHLLALPLIGTGAGGLHHGTGYVIQKMLSVLDKKAEILDIDVVLVLYEKDVYVAAQKERSRLMPFKYKKILAPHLVEAIEKLSDIAISNDLALFIGAGASMGAGLPSWSGLLHDLASELSIDKKEFEALGALDKAKIIDRRLRKRDRDLGKEISQRLHSRYFSLTHALLRSLPTDSVLTTNYDNLYEMAYKSASFTGNKLSILPYNPQLNSERFLLKMHGCINHPDDIVLTRKDYMRYSQKRSVLGGVLQSTLLTKHLLYVGFSLTDSNFQTLFDTVRNHYDKDVNQKKRSTMPSSPRKKHSNGYFKLCERNTALLLKSRRLEKELWDNDVEIVPISTKNNAHDQASYASLARKQDIFLDVLTSECILKTGVTSLLDPRYEPLLSGPESKLKEIIENFIHQIEENEIVFQSKSFSIVEKMISTLGGNIYFSHLNPLGDLFAGISNKDCSKIKIEALKLYAEALNYESKKDIDNAVIYYKKSFTLWPGVEEAVKAFLGHMQNDTDMDAERRMNSKTKCILRMIQKFSETADK